MGYEGADYVNFRTRQRKIKYLGHLTHCQRCGQPASLTELEFEGTPDALKEHGYMPQAVMWRLWPVGFMRILYAVANTPVSCRVCRAERKLRVAS